MPRILLACLIAITFCLTPIATFASTADLSPSLSNLTKDFSEKFCTSIREGLTPEKAGESAAAQLSKSLFFTPLMNEIMSTPKKDLAASLSNNIFGECGNSLGGSKEELDDYLSQLAKKVPSKSNKSYQLVPIQQKPST